MFWSGLVIGIFIGAGLGILVMSMAISVGRRDYDADYRTYYETEHSEELVPDLEDKDKKIDRSSDESL
ncbi:MAG TPA: hypothetical protein PLC16_12225 [Defluviitaleaceae bacterium]|nr:hypothetical protein [Defluviitaleaceae bacterium]HPT77452.1 hypothetical protein [Defluviitaleaceae bacterium]